MTALGQKIRDLRTSRGMTQQRLAEMADVSHSLISALESGRRKYVSAPEIDRVADALDLAADDLWRLIPGGRSEARYIPITEPSQGRTA
jgi:transcriptional regulator with XRE-family HTH domain